jgi:sugar/nucleoside kinase (ribokinase family)
MPDDLAAILAARADIVAYSRREADFFARALSAAARGAPKTQWRLETRGADGVTLTRSGRSETFAVDPLLDVEDFTGAGDTFVGGFLAGLITNGDAKTAVAAGAHAARDMLAARRAAKEALI